MGVKVDLKILNDNGICCFIFYFMIDIGFRVRFFYWGVIFWIYWKLGYEYVVEGGWEERVKER